MLVKADVSHGRSVDCHGPPAQDPLNMNTPLIIAAAMMAFAAGPALAQDHAAHHPEGAAASKPMDMSKMTPEQMHKHCALVMGGKMQGPPKHDHSADKLGHAPATTPPTNAEMKAMHDRCAAMMAAKTPTAAPAKK
jgi:hypothetical protein